ncbi:hypothetical protein [Streptomyces boncukensis]|uniref:Uncharacterized protein n=1 Tax=Streptomyces boncukensis TaxID=2711219 RepID=A0A6G4WXP6_9ACTN|nr:hypothetical protein [Streptomyces boncukensis]NGO70005.1 hypothetical protein [Streptomyces boncukensis]
MTEESAQSVAVELERLRGTVTTGFAEVKGSLAVLVEQSNRNREDLQQLRADTEKDITDLRADVEAFKRTRWPLPSLAALTGLGALAVSLYQQLAR